MRSARDGSGASLGWSSGPADDTLDTFTECHAFHTSDNKVRFEFIKYSADGRRINYYEFVADDESFLLDLAATSVQAIVAIHSHEDSRERMAEYDALQPNALDAPEDIERKQAARRNRPTRAMKKGRVSG